MSLNKIAASSSNLSKGCIVTSKAKSGVLTKVKKSNLSFESSVFWEVSTGLPHNPKGRRSGFFPCNALINLFYRSFTMNFRQASREASNILHTVPVPDFPLGGTMSKPSLQMGVMTLRSTLSFHLTEVQSEFHGRRLN